jgi:hypothetical protein
MFKKLLIDVIIALLTGSAERITRDRKPCLTRKKKGRKRDAFSQAPEDRDGPEAPK